MAVLVNQTQRVRESFALILVKTTGSGVLYCAGVDLHMAEHSTSPNDRLSGDDFQSQWIFGQELVSMRSLVLLDHVCEATLKAFPDDVYVYRAQVRVVEVDCPTSNQDWYRTEVSEPLEKFVQLAVRFIVDWF